MGLLSRIFSKKETAAARAEWLDGLMRTAAARTQAHHLDALSASMGNITGTRGFESAETPAWTDSWPTTAAGINDDLSRQLPTLRARSRSQARSNEWAVNYLIKLRDNVLGDAGILLQATGLRLPSGEADKATADRLEAAHKKWGRAADVSGASWRAVELTALRSLAVDGELLYRLRPGSGPFKFQIQMLPADMLDVNVTRDWGGNRVIMGVEINDDGVPLYYWLKATKYGDSSDGIGQVGKHVRVPSAEIRHFFLAEEVGQVRGYPWLSAGAQRLWLLKDFEQSAAVASSNAAKRQGFFFTPDGSAPQGFVDRYISTAVEQAKAEGRELEPDELARIMAAAEKFATAMPGQYDTLPVGYDFRPFESKWPEISADGYVKQQVRGWTAARGISYVSGGNDLEAVNYSSAQVGIIAEREHYRTVQQDLIAWLHEEVFAALLPYLVLATPGLLPRNIHAYAAATTWQPRRWQGIDPLKAAKANGENLANRLTSRRRIALEQGIDPDDLFAEIEDEEKRFGAPEKAAAVEPPPDRDDE